MPTPTSIRDGYCTSYQDIQIGTQIYVYQPVNEKGEWDGDIDLNDAYEAVGMSDTYYWFCPHDDWHSWEEAQAHIKEQLEELSHIECKYVLDGTDTDGTKWYKCLTHGELAPSPDAPCAGYQAKPYNEHRENN